MHDNGNNPISTPGAFNGTHVDFVTLVLAMSKTLGDVDTVGEAVLQMVSFDIAPYPDFKSMRLALQDQCDMAGFQAKAQEWAKEQFNMINALDDAGIGLDPELGGLGSTLEFFNAFGVSTKTMEMIEARNQFLRMSDPPENLFKQTWNASLAEFTALVFITALQVKPGVKDGDMLLENCLRWYLGILNVDLQGFPDYSSLSAVYLSSSYIDKLLAKADRLSRAHKIALDRFAGPAIRPFNDYILQRMYNTKAADELCILHWDVKPEVMSYAFDIIFIADDMLDEMLREAAN